MVIESWDPLQASRHLGSILSVNISSNGATTVLKCESSRLQKQAGSPKPPTAPRTSALSWILDAPSNLIRQFSGPAEDQKTKSIDAILNAYKSAHERGVQPGIILLQASKPCRLAKHHLQTLVTMLATKDQDQTPWNYIISKRSNYPYVAIIYNSAIYNAEQLHLDADIDATAAGSESSSFAHQPHFGKHWIAAHFGTASKPSGARNMQFIVACCHADEHFPPVSGRRASNGRRLSWRGKQLQPSPEKEPKVDEKKKLQQFEAYIEHLQKLSAAEAFKFGVSGGADAASSSQGFTGIPLVICGDWGLNPETQLQPIVDITKRRSSFSAFAPPLPLPVESVRLDLPLVDGAAIINHEPRHTLSCKAAVSEVTVIPHPPRMINMQFTHDPLLVRFSVTQMPPVPVAGGGKGKKNAPKAKGVGGASSTA